jgi:hypothetical protein
MIGMAVVVREFAKSEVIIEANSFLQPFDQPRAF